MSTYALLLLGMQFIEGAGRYFFCSTEIHRNEPFRAPPQGREGLGHGNEGLCVLCRRAAVQSQAISGLELSVVPEPVILPHSTEALECGEC